MLYIMHLHDLWLCFKFISCDFVFVSFTSNWTIALLCCKLSGYTLSLLHRKIYILGLGMVSLAFGIFL